VPRKNVLMLAGKPLLGWTVEAAIRSSTVDDVVVSTDSPEIADVAEEFGASVVWRPAEISGDLATSEDALIHSINSLADDGRSMPDITVFLQCTAPLIISDDIDGTVDALIRNNADTAVAVADFHYFLWEMSDDGDLIGINHDKQIRQLRQQRKANYIETGSVYAMKTREFLKYKHRFFGKTARYVTPPERVLEIDEPVDYQIAEVLLRERLRAQQTAALPSRVQLIVFDFDGVFTDDHVFVSQDGTEAVRCSRSDGMGVKLARNAGIRMLILSTEENPVVSQRADKLRVDVLQGVENKLATLSAYLAEHQIDWADTIYVGNDINDAECLRKVGCGVAVADANASAIASSDMILSSGGGQNAVRELIDLVLAFDGACK